MGFFYVLIGGSIGALLRYIISGVVHEYSKTSFPVGTFAVNILGSFITGFLWEHFLYVAAPSTLRTFIFIGVLGSFTTFSAYSLETLSLLKEKGLSDAILNVFANNIFGILACLAGFIIGKYLRSLLG